MFERLDRIVEIAATYRALGSLAVHASKDAPFQATDSPVIKIGGTPVIPGSSIKGVLRSTLEALLVSDGLQVCVPAAAIPKPPRNVDRRTFESGYVKRIGRSAPCSVDNPCQVCDIFGTTGDRQGLSGRALFLDARAQGEITVVERSHVAIMRDTKSQSAGSLMSIQAIDAGAVFEGMIRLINPDDWHVGGLIHALDTVSMTGVGAKKTSGYGELDIGIKSIKSYSFRNGTRTDAVVNGPDFLAAFRKMIAETKKG